MLLALAVLAPLQVTLRGGLSVTVFEAQCQEEALEAAIESGSDPYGSVCWPSSLMLANELAELAERRGSLSGLRVLEIGAGSGLVSVVAMHLGADVIATDVADLPLNSLLPASLRGAVESGAPGTYRVEKLDILAGQDLPRADLICASDLLYENSLAEALGRLLAESSRSFLVTDPGRRQGREEFLKRLKHCSFVDKELSLLETRGFRLADSEAATKIGVCSRIRESLLSAATTN